MPKLSISLTLAAAVLVVAAGVAQAQDDSELRAELRLRESVVDTGLTALSPDGSYVLNITARNADTADLTSVTVEAGDVLVTFPLTRGKFDGRIREGDVDVRANVVARRGRVTIHMEGKSEDGEGSIFGAKAFEAAADADHWDGTIFGIEQVTLSLDGEAHVIPVAIAGRTDRKRRGTGRFELTSDDRFRVTLNGIGRIAGPDRARAELQLVPRIAGERWDGRIRGQVLLSNADEAILEMSVDGLSPVRVMPFDREALDISGTQPLGDGLASAVIDGRTVVQMRFDTAVPAVPGPHIATFRTVSVPGDDLLGSQVLRGFTVQPTAMPLVMDVNGQALEVRFDGIIRAWGDNAFGVVGNGLTRNPMSPFPLFSMNDVVDVGAGEFFSIAVDGSGTTFIWGGFGEDTAPFGSFPEIFEGLPELVSIDAGSTHAVGLDAQGNVFTFGRNDFGQLGDGTVDPRVRDPREITELPNIVAVAAGFSTTVVLDDQGQVWTWGDQRLVGIGDGTLPVLVEGLPEIVAIDTRNREFGESVTIALGADGTVWTWGGSQQGGATPTRIAALRNIVAISSGGSHDLFLDANGRVWARGANFAGQLGDGTHMASLEPVRVLGLERIVRIFAGNEVSFAVDEDGNTWIWGTMTDFLGVSGTRTLPVLAPREFVPGNFRISEDSSTVR